MSIRKAQIQAFKAQAMAVDLLGDAAETAESELGPELRAWQKAQDILNTMRLAGYAPRRWGAGLAARIETGDETPEQIAEYDNAEWGGGM